MNAVLRAVIVSWLLGAVAACSLLPGFGSPARQLSSELPATFHGTLPCADCAGVDYWLQLRADGTYFQRQTFPQRSPSDDVGRWFISSDGAVLMLAGGRAVADRFRIDSGQRLIKLDQTGRPMRPHNAHSIRRVRSAPVLEPQLRLTGRYLFSGGSASFEECHTGLNMSVLGPAAEKMEAAYLADRTALREPLLVSLYGRLRGVDGSVRRPVALEVLRFERTRPDVDCRSRDEVEHLVGTHWRLVRLGGETIAEIPGEAGPFLKMRSAGQLAGSTGCDELSGRYWLRGDALWFSDLEATSAACPGDVVLELMFTDALKSASRWRMLGPWLELYSEDGAKLAQFEALSQDVAQ